MANDQTERVSELRYLQAVLWSFFGIRRGAKAREDIARLRPVPLVLTAVVIAAAFVCLLLLVAHAASDGGGSA